MRLQGLLVLVLSSAIMTGSGHRSLAGAPSLELIKTWKHQNVLAYRHAQRPDRFQAELAEPRRLSRLYPHHYLAAKTSELAGYSLSLQLRYADATREYVTAKALAEAAGDSATVAVAANALSNIYLISGNLAGALEAARQAVQTALPKPNPEFQAALQNHYARLLARNGRFEEARRVFMSVIEFSERERLPGARADAWKLMGREFMLRGELRRAESALTEALRLRSLTGDREIASDYHDLAEIRLSAGRPAEALQWLSLAEHNLSRSRRFVAWRFYLLRGKTQLALGASQTAVAELRRAVRGIDASPSYRLPGDLLRSQTTRPTEAHELFAEAALNEYERTGNHDLLDQAFAATEAGRAAALRSAQAGPPVPLAYAARYWNLVADLDEASARLLTGDDGEGRRKIERLRLTLAELETGSDHSVSPPVSLLDQPPPIRHLREGEALIGFQLGTRLSVAWTIAGGRLEATRLPGRAAVSRQLKEWLDTAPGRERQLRAHQLFQTLMGSLPSSVQAAKLWLVAPDGDLFQAPLAALVTGFDSSRPIYLAERHALQIIPGAWALERRRPAVRTGRFLGIGDPIYNEGDPRGTTRRRWWWPVSVSSAELPRLASSTAEITACARFWPSSQTLLGGQATPEVFARSLQEMPAAIHLAIHVVPAPDRASENLIALGTGSEGHPAFIGPEWVGAQRIPGSLVVMNGCRSGSGAISSSEGLLGLTRAWLRAGASRVVSTYWPTLDDGGQLAAAFYRELTTGAAPSTAEALRRVQAEMISRSDWRADPQYWAAYFLIGYPE